MRILIVGNSLAGKSCACFLKYYLKDNVTITIIEKTSRGLSSSNPKFIESNVSPLSNSLLFTGLWSPALMALNSIGLYNHIHKYLEPVKESGYRSQDGNWLIYSKCGLKNIGENCPNNPSLAFINNSILLQTLDNYINEYSGVVLHQDTTLEKHLNGSFFEEGAKNSTKVKLKSGKKELEQTFDLIIAADGQHSDIRQDIYDGNSVLEYRGYQVYRGVCNYDYRSPSFQTWGRCSLEKGARFAAVPIKQTEDDDNNNDNNNDNGHGIAWFAALQDSPLSQEMEMEIEMDKLRKRFANWHDPIDRMISNSSVCSKSNAIAFGKPIKSKSHNNE